MVRTASARKPCRAIGLSLALAAGVLGWALMPARADKAADVLRAAISYVFTGSISPGNGFRIVDLKACIVVMPDRQSKRFIRYYLSRFKMDDARISKLYSGEKPRYTLDVAGDDIIIEYLSPDQKTVVAAYKTAQIALPGDIEQTKKALEVIFAGSCKGEKPELPF